MRAISRVQAILLVAVFLMVVANSTFFSQVLAVYPWESGNYVFLVSLALVFGAINALLLGIICISKATRYVLILLLIASSQAAYFMDTYVVVIDDSMLENMAKTDVAETLDLLSWQQLFYFVAIALVPGWLLWRWPEKKQTFKQAALGRVALIGGSAALAVGLVLLNSSHFASFLREHKPLRYYNNPSYYIYSVGRYVGRHFKTAQQPLVVVGEDARHTASAKRRLVVFVVGETTRADHFSLNGYERLTNPRLSQETLLSYSDVWACGTSTAYSLPCMFSFDGFDDYDRDRARHTEGVLDVIQRAGVNVVWIDNNSDSKGAADRIEFLNYKTADNNPECDIECRDIGMLQGLKDYVARTSSGDILVVLHQMGNHGPAYYKRYRPEFEHFKPVCETNQLEQCERQAIVNAYDNVLVATDDFLAETLALLKSYNEFETAMLYVGDHGESLGEGDLYLHGLPYAFAPDEQKHVPMLLWYGKQWPDSLETAAQRRDEKLNHDVLSHTLLGLTGVSSQLYQPALDLRRVP